MNASPRRGLSASGAYHLIILFLLAVILSSARYVLATATEATSAKTLTLIPNTLNLWLSPGTIIYRPTKWRGLL
jgi:hypothetical protein